MSNFQAEPSTVHKVIYSMKTLHLIFLMVFLIISSTTNAETIRFRDAKHLKRGMSASEVLYLVGQPDYKTLRDAYWTNKQIWYYIPHPKDYAPWETIIYFDARGYVQKVERNKILRRRR
ncbi:MAG: outer membrane protein assembly factor BamE [Gammaproteobacteria bacterium]|nr:MAG: outer membrane protein assembly factor BamE [Gammaproteobacteria bacterium]